VAHVTEDLISSYANSDGLGLAELVHAGKVAPEELVEAAVTVIERLDPQLNAVVHKLYDIGRAMAPQVDRTLPFAGVPYLLKELASMWAGTPMTNCCGYMRHLVAPTDTEIVRRTRKAGFLLLGKTNAPENGWCISTEPKLYGATHNPWRKDVTPGGSSGGSTAAVAARLVPVAEAGDGAGSIRVPASCCGIVGLKPSRGRVTPMPSGEIWNGCAFTLCVSRSVRDTAAYLDAIAGAMPGDAYIAPKPETSWLDLSKRAPVRLRIGFSLAPPDGTGVHPEVQTAVRNTVAMLQSLGHDVEEHDLPSAVADIWGTYTDTTCVETARLFEVLAPIVGAPVTQADVEPLTWAIIQRGRSIGGVANSANLEAVRVASRMIATDLDRYDVFLTPTLTQPPRPLGYLDMSETDLDRYHAKWTDAGFMYPFNISGQPALSLPLHWSNDGLPIGVQFVGRHGDEGTLLALAGVLEQEMPWRDRKPPISA
jgi:amidase